MCIDSDETVRYNLLLEDQEESIEETLEEEAEDTQDMCYDTEMIQLEEEEDDTYLDDSADQVIEEDADKFEVLDIEEIKHGIRIDNRSNIAIVSNSESLIDDDDVTAKMKAAHFAKEQLKKHKCPYCDKTFMYPSKGEMKNLRKSICIKIILILVNRHVVAVHRDLNRPKKNIKKNHTCPICNKAFVSNFKVRRHMVVHDTEMKTGLQKNWTRNYHMCPKCDRKFHTRGTYDRHSIICDRLRKSDLKRPAGYEFKCVMCLEAFKQHDDMADHMKNMHHQEGDQQLMCMICSDYTGIVPELIKHGRNHEENCTYKCCDCGKYFPNGDEVYTHLLRHANYKPFECSHEGCKKRFFDRYKLKTHMLIHDPNTEAKFICDECQRPFTQLEYLNCHIRRRHSKVKPYSCTFCTKSFAFTHDLSLHLTVHTGNKKHICPVCDASFTKAWSLKQHMMQHEVNPAKFQCPDCNYSSISKTHLQKHMELHTNNMNDTITYICEECDIEFKAEEELKFHLEETHQNEYTFMDANSSDPYSLVEIPTNY